MAPNHLTLSTKKLKKYFSFIHASPTSSTQSSPFPLDEKISLVAPRPPAPPQKSQNVTVITLSSLSRQTSRDPSSSLSTASNNGLSFFRRRPSVRKSAPKAGAPGGPRTSSSVTRTSGSRPGSANARSRPGSGTVVVASGSGAAPSAFKGVKGSSRRHTFGQEEVVEKKKKPRPLPPRGAIVPTQTQVTVEDDVEPTLPKVDKGKQRDFDPSPSPSPSPSLSSTSSPRRHHQRNLSFPLDSYSPVHTEPPVTRFGFKNLILHSDGRGYDDHDEQDPPSPVPPPHVSIPAAHDTPRTKTRELEPPVIAQQHTTKSRPLPKVPPPSPPAGHPPSSPSPTSYSSSSSSSANTMSAAAVSSKPIAVPSQPSPRHAVPAPPSPPHAAPPILPSSSAALLSPTIPSSSSSAVTSLSASSSLPTSAHTPVPADADADGEKRRERGEGHRLLISSAPAGRLRGKRNQPLPRTPVSPPPLTTTTMVQSPTQHIEERGLKVQAQMEGDREGERVQHLPSPPPRVRKESVTATQAGDTGLGTTLTPAQNQPSSSPTPPPSHNQPEVQPQTTSTLAPLSQTHRSRTSSTTTKAAQQTQAGTATQRLLQQQVQRQKQREQLQTLFRQESEASALGSLARAGTSSSKTSAAAIANSKSTTMAAMETGALSEQVTRKVQIGEPRRLRKGSLPAAAPGGPQPPRPPPKIFRSTSVANSVSSYALTPATKAHVNPVPPPASVVSSISNMSTSTSTSSNSNSNSTSTPSSNSTSTVGRGSTSTPTPTHPNTSASTSSKGKTARMTVTPVSPAPRSPGRYIPPPPRPPPRHQPLPPTPITSSTSTSSPPSSSTQSQVHVQSPPPPAAPKTPPTSSNTPQVQAQVSVSARPPPTAFARSASTGVVSEPTTRVVSVQPPPSARPPPPASLQRAMSSAVVGTRGPRGAVGARGVVGTVTSVSEGGLVAMTVGPRTRVPSVPVPSPSVGGGVKALPAVPLAPVPLSQSIPISRATPHSQQVKQPPRVPTELALQAEEGVEVETAVRDGASGSWSAKVREMSERLGDVSHHVEAATGGVSEPGRGGGGAAVSVQGKRRPLPVPPTPSSR